SPLSRKITPRFLEVWMRLRLGVAIFSCCALVGAATFVLAQGQPPAGAPPAQGGGAPAGGAPAGGRPGGGGGGQQPAPTNLKVLPKTWTRQQVGTLMQTFVTS